jgi:hypothetical protein
MRVPPVALLLVGMLMSPVAAHAADTPRLEVAAGYAFLHDEDISENFPWGWIASVEGNVTSWLRLVGEVGGSYRTLPDSIDPPRLTVYSLTGGPKFTARSYGRIVPFAQVVFGAALSSSGVGDWDADFAYQPGGGIDMNFNPHIGVRLEADYRIISRIRRK